MDKNPNQKIHKCREYVNFMLSQQQWSGLTKAATEQWLNNFQDLSSEEMSLVYKLLVHLIYYSENDVINALKEGVDNLLFHNILLEKQKSENFGLSPKAISNIVKGELQKTCFIPLLDCNSPHESGNYVSRLLVQQQLIDPSQSMFLSDIVSPIEKGTFTRLVVVDDCMGSGDQLRNFWSNNATLIIEGVEIPLKKFCNSNSVEVNYLTLFGYDKSINNLVTEIPELKIYCVRTLSDSQRVFNENSYVWADDTEQQQAKALFLELANAHEFPLLGYRSFDFAFIMHKTIPDWSLPLFWKERSDWNLLMRRKNSND